MDEASSIWRCARLLERGLVDDLMTHGGAVVCGGLLSDEAFVAQQ